MSGVRYYGGPRGGAMTPSTYVNCYVLDGVCLTHPAKAPICAIESNRLPWPIPEVTSAEILKNMQDIIRRHDDGSFQR